MRRSCSWCSVIWFLLVYSSELASRPHRGNSRPGQSPRRGRTRCATSRPTTAHAPAWPPDQTHRCQNHRRPRSEEHTSELQSRFDLVCRLLLEKKKSNNINDNDTII